MSRVYVNKRCIDCPHGISREHAKDDDDDDARRKTTFKKLRTQFGRFFQKKALCSCVGLDITSFCALGSIMLQ